MYETQWDWGTSHPPPHPPPGTQSQESSNWLLEVYVAGGYIDTLKNSCLWKLYPLRVNFHSHFHTYILVHKGSFCLVQCMGRESLPPIHPSHSFPRKRKTYHMIGEMEERNEERKLSLLWVLSRALSRWICLPTGTSRPGPRPALRGRYRVQISLTPLLWLNRGNEAGILSPTTLVGLMCGTEPNL